MTQGNAEIFGTELAESRRYQFTGFNFAVFTWYGCTIKVEGKCHAYIAGETPMASYLNTHAVVEEKRLNAASRNTPGPRVSLTSSICMAVGSYTSPRWLWSVPQTPASLRYAVSSLTMLSDAVCGQHTRLRSPDSRSTPTDLHRP